MFMLQLLILGIIVGIVVVLVRSIPKSDCTGDCDQGRNCDCKNKRT
jgi:hypothetical protein